MVAAVAQQTYWIQPVHLARFQHSSAKRRASSLFCSTMLFSSCMRFNPFFCEITGDARGHTTSPCHGKESTILRRGPGRLTIHVFQHLLTAQMASRTVQQVSRLRGRVYTWERGRKVQMLTFNVSFPACSQQKEGEEIRVLQPSARRDSLTATFLVESLLSLRCLSAALLVAPCARFARLDPYKFAGTCPLYLCPHTPGGATKRRLS